MSVLFVKTKNGTVGKNVMQYLYTRQVLCEVAIFLVFFQLYFTMNKTTIYTKKASPNEYLYLFLYRE